MKLCSLRNWLLERPAYPVKGLVKSFEHPLRRGLIGDYGVEIASAQRAIQGERLLSRGGQTDDKGDALEFL